MSEAETLLEDEVPSGAERLLEESWEGRERRASERELIVEAAAATLFAAAAATMLLLGATAGLAPGIAALLIGVYAMVVRIEFPVGAGHVVPTYLILIPMLLILPPAVVPAAVAVGLVGGNALDWALGRVPPRRVLSAVPDAWHAVGAAGVLLIAGSPRLGFGNLPLLAAAFAAACAVDLASSLVRMRLIGVVPEIRLQLQVIVLVWAVDACLAPLGFLAGLVTRRDAGAILFVLPLVFLLWLLARDRSQRIDQAHRRLKLVEQERARLQSAVRRLGDAFAAKLELDGLLEILLHGSLEALDADGGRLALTGGASPVSLRAGADSWQRLLEIEVGAGAGPAAPLQRAADGAWLLGIPMRIAAEPAPVAGSLWFARADRAFEADEVALISGLVSKAELSAAEILAHHAIREQAMTDALTGLGNRRRLSADLDDVFGGGRGERPSMLLLFDLDGFKNYNDTFGHLAGDALLERLGTRLRRAVEGAGAAYRLGGDEFCAHLDLEGRDPGALIRSTAAALAESGDGYSIQASFGVVLLPHEARYADRALQTADQRMYATKRSRANAARNQAGQVLLGTMRAKAPELDQHSANVAHLAARVARRLGLEGEALEEICTAGELHDIGKLGLPDAILDKPGALDAQELEAMRTHTILGERILQAAPSLQSVAQVVRASHERWDGTGYPDRLAGEEIPLASRIVGVCDAYDAMTCERAYRHAATHEAACEELRRGAGGQFDPDLVEAFLSVIEAGEERVGPDAAQRAAAHVRDLLAAAGDGLDLDRPQRPGRRFAPGRAGGGAAGPPPQRASHTSP